MIINLNKQQCEDIIQVLENEIICNDSFMDDIKDEEEKKSWIDWDSSLTIIIQKIRESIKAESESSRTIILQELTPEQEDYILESELEHIRSERELQRDIYEKEAKEVRAELSIKYDGVKTDE